jgi:hydrogenase maturation factor
VSTRTDPAPRCEPTASEPGCGCITCGDEALPLRVLEIYEATGLALCESGEGERESVEIALVGPLVPGDTVLVHAGTAIAQLPAEVIA